VARRQKTSPFEDLIEISSNISWKVSLSIALVSYLGFHYAASMSMPIATNLHAVTDSIPKQIFITFSKFLQYLVPAAFLIGACVSVFKGKHRVKLLEEQSGIQSIRAMSWQDFELLIGEAFRRKSFEVMENGGGGADGGIDLILHKGGRKSIVQCKRWKNYSINVSLVRELYGVMTAERATECIFVSSGSYTSEARLFAEGKPIWLIDGSELVELVAGVQTQRKSIKLSQVEPIKTAQEVLPQHCPVCGSGMVRRVAKKGSNAGNEFWGCSKFPACRGVR
jgi:restriction system protein